MAERIHARLAYWVRLKDNELGRELLMLGEDPGPPMRERARTLFARVLESAGGGLRIQTIHAFAQSLLAAFPAEAGLIPGFRPLEGREEKLLARIVLAETLVAAEREGDQGLIRDLQALSLRLGEGGAEAFLKACAAAPDAHGGTGPARGDRGAAQARLRPAARRHGRRCSPANATTASISALLSAIAEANRAWGTKGGIERRRALRCSGWPGRRPNAPRRLERAASGLGKSGRRDPRSSARGRRRRIPNYAALARRSVRALRPAAHFAPHGGDGGCARRGPPRRAELRPRL